MREVGSGEVRSGKTTHDRKRISTWPQGMVCGMSQEEHGKVPNMAVGKGSEEQWTVEDREEV